MYQAKSFSGEGGLKKSVAQNGLKCILVLEFLRTDEILENFVCESTNKQASNIHTFNGTNAQTPKRPCR